MIRSTPNLDVTGTVAGAAFGVGSLNSSKGHPCAGPNPPRHLVFVEIMSALGTEHHMPKYEKTPEAIAKLSPEQYRVTQKSGTERPGTGQYLHNKEPGIYVDVVSASRCSRPPINLNRVAAGQASPSPSNRPTSTSCGI
jgi:hypothetical protein